MIDLKDKYLYIIDVRFKKKNFTLLDYNIKANSEILSLTPYSSYLIDSIGKEHKIFHDIISELEFHNIVLDEYRKIEKVFLDYQNYYFLFRDFSFIKTFEIYLKVLFDFLDMKKLENYKIIYLTDADSASNEDMGNNAKSYIYSYDNIDKTIKIENKDIVFYKKNGIYFKISILLYTKNIIFKIFNRYINNLKNKSELNYDSRNFKYIYEKIESIDVKNKLPLEDINSFTAAMENVLINKKKINFIAEKYSEILTDFGKNILHSSNISTLKFHPFTFLTKMKNYIEVLLYEKNNIPNIFMQHGSYLHENIFLKYNEIYPADINFVFNDFTKTLFEKRGAKKVYSIGSINFNYPIIEKEKEYDFLYIIYCTSYAYAGVQIFSKDNVLSIDGNNIYQRHVDIVHLFGTKFKNKNICIKIQSGIFTGTMLYVPFLELCKKYNNINIEFTTPISKLFEKCKYIISDYFSSEFTNRELHYKKNIILFKGLPLPLPEEIVEDMKKMFILVDSVNDLKAKIENIEEIAKNRKRYDAIIEYYSSKNCDTKKVVEEILKDKENN